MKDKIIPLTKLQKEIMQEFYSIAQTKVIFSKTERKKLWESYHLKYIVIHTDLSN